MFEYSEARLQDTNKERQNSIEIDVSACLEIKTTRDIQDEWKNRQEETCLNTVQDYKILKTDRILLK